MINYYSTLSAIWGVSITVSTTGFHPANLGPIPRRPTMTRSYKKHAIIKDHTGRWYNKLIRRTNKMEVKDISKLKDIDTYEITNPKVIVNDYDVCDYVYRLSKKIKDYDLLIRSFIKK